MRKSLLQGLLMSALLIVAVFSFQHLSLSASAQGGLIDPSIRPGSIGVATNNEESLTQLVKSMINYFLGFLAILTLAMIIYGGFMYVTAGVNESGAETGKKVLIYSFIGIVIILLSYVIVSTLLSAGSQSVQ